MQWAKARIALAECRVRALELLCTEYGFLQHDVRAFMNIYKLGYVNVSGDAAQRISICRGKAADTRSQLHHFPHGNLR